MKIHDLVFTTKTPQRYYRHLLFWFVWFIWKILYNILPMALNNSLMWSDVTGVFKLALFLLACLMFFCYTIVYWLLPKYFYKKKYILFTGGVIIITIVDYFMIASFFEWNHSYDELFPSIWNSFFAFSLNGPPVTCCFFIALKILKNYYLKIEERETLAKENANAELQLLKAQVHPHFLFNTLNNIYSFTLNRSPKAAEMVMQLSDMMKYMINDCETELVSLSKELKMMRDYIGLEKVRYGSRLDMQVEVTGNYNNKAIVPLLMMPFVENSFKHGTSKMLRDPWIKLFIQADENILHFSLTNSKPADEIVTSKGGIGLNNVKKRLELLYPQNHLLVIESTENTFTVNMQIPLYKIQEKVVA